MPPDMVVASWNVHSGVDGWSRPFDVVASCRSIDADVLILQETWTTEGGQSLARLVGDALGYHVYEVAIARAVMWSPDPEATAKWGPPMWWRSVHGTRVDKRPKRLIAPPKLHSYEPQPYGGAAPMYDPHSGEARSEEPGVVEPAIDDSRPFVPDQYGRAGRTVRRGTIGLALLTRMETGYTEAWDLGQLRSDPTRRSAIAVEVVTGTRGTVSKRSALIVGTHLSHLRQGSPLQISRMRKELARRAGPAVPAVLAGDMNLPGLPLRALVPGWRRCVRGPTWPSWHPLGQSDHVLLTDAMTGEGEVLRITGSDHLPVRAELHFA